MAYPNLGNQDGQLGAPPPLLCHSAFNKQSLVAKGKNTDKPTQVTAMHLAVQINKKLQVDILFKSLITINVWKAV